MKNAAVVLLVLYGKTRHVPMPVPTLPSIHSAAGVPRPPPTAPAKPLPDLNALRVKIQGLQSEIASKTAEKQKFEEKNAVLQSQVEMAHFNLSETRRVAASTILP